MQKKNLYNYCEQIVAHGLDFYFVGSKTQLKKNTRVVFMRKKI